MQEEYFCFLDYIDPLMYSPFVNKQHKNKMIRSCYWNEFTSEYRLYCPQQIFYKNEQGFCNFPECVGVTFTNLDQDEVIDKDYFTKAPLLKSYTQMMNWADQNPDLKINEMHLWMNRSHTFDFETRKILERPKGQWIEYYNFWKAKLGYFADKDTLLKTRRFTCSWFEANTDIFKNDSNQIDMISIPCPVTMKFWEPCEILNQL